MFNQQILPTSLCFIQMFVSASVVSFYKYSLLLSAKLNPKEKKPDTPLRKTLATCEMASALVVIDGVNGTGLCVAAFDLIQSTLTSFHSILFQIFL